LTAVAFYIESLYFLLQETVQGRATIVSHYRKYFSATQLAENSHFHQMTTEVERYLAGK
jgi:hypothetical protein